MKLDSFHKEMISKGWTITIEPYGKWAKTIFTPPEKK